MNSPPFFRLWQCPECNGRGYEIKAGTDTTTPTPRKNSAVPKLLGSNLRRKASNQTNFRSEIFYQAGIDQHAVELARLGAVIAAVEKSVAAHEDLLLRGERPDDGANRRPPPRPPHRRAV